MKFSECQTNRVTYCYDNWLLWSIYFTVTITYKKLIIVTRVYRKEILLDGFHQLVVEKSSWINTVLTALYKKLSNVSWDIIMDINTQHHWRYGLFRFLNDLKISLNIILEKWIFRICAYKIIALYESYTKRNFMNATPDVLTLVGKFAISGLHQGKSKSSWLSYLMP